MSPSVRHGGVNQTQQSCRVKAHSERLRVPSPHPRRTKMQIKNTMAPNSRGWALETLRNESRPETKAAGTPGWLRRPLGSITHRLEPPGGGRARRTASLTGGGARKSVSGLQTEFTIRKIKAALSLQPLLSFGSISFLRALLLVQIVHECSGNRR